MKFFVDRTEYTYPDDPIALRAKIINDSAAGPQKIPFTYFEKYFKNNGTAIHPLLGDLAVLVTEINDAWQGDGINLVAGYIEHQLSQLANRLQF